MFLTQKVSFLPLLFLFLNVTESKTDFFACEQLSGRSLAMISLLRIFHAILNSTYRFLSILRIGTQAPTFAFFCARTALPVKEAITL